MSTPAYLVLPEGEALVAVGANLGDARATIEAAIAAIAQLPATHVLATSRLHTTAPVGPPQPDYLNGVVHLRTSLAPLELLESLLAIERGLGRTRPDPVRWGPRAIDLDLVAHGAMRIDDPMLVLPHPRAVDRLFVLGPLADLVPAGSPAGDALATRVRELTAEAAGTTADRR